MNTLLNLEEIGQFALAVLLFNQLDYQWWMFPACLLLPDLSMIGYLINPKAGACVYNLFHHKLLAILVGGVGFWMGDSLLIFAGIILFAHAAMDRLFGYGLKFEDSFKHTHMGWIGKKAE